MSQLIIDEFTNLKVSRQRKYQLRNPEKNRELKKNIIKLLNIGYIIENLIGNTLAGLKDIYGLNLIKMK